MLKKKLRPFWFLTLKKFQIFNQDVTLTFLKLPAGLDSAPVDQTELLFFFKDMKDVLQISTKKHCFHQCCIGMEDMKKKKIK